MRWPDGGGAFLVECWDELDLPDPIREAWSPTIREAASSRRVDVFSAFDQAPGESPEVARAARIRRFTGLDASDPSRGGPDGTP